MTTLDFSKCKTKEDVEKIFRDKEEELKIVKQELQKLKEKK